MSELVGIYEWIGVYMTLLPFLYDPASVMLTAKKVGQPCAK